MLRKVRSLGAAIVLGVGLSAVACGGSDAAVVVDDWEWERAAIPDGFTGYDWTYSGVAAAAADDVLVCAQNMVDGTGGVLQFDGAVVAPAVDGFECQNVWALGADHVYAFGSGETGVGSLYGRSAGAWSVSPYEGQESCAIRAAYVTASGEVALAGECWFPPDYLMSRRTWAQDAAGDWIAAAGPVPTPDELPAIGGVLALPETELWYGWIPVGYTQPSGMWESAGGTALGWSGGALWVGGAALDGLLALGDGERAVMEFGGAAWSERLACPFELGDWESCWHAAALDGASGDLYLGGTEFRGGEDGEGGFYDWRLHRLAADGTLYRILAPCGGDAPECRVWDLGLAPGGVLFALAEDPGPALLWHPIPVSD